MSLSNELISQFVKISKDETEVKNETTVKGTIKVVNNVSYVRLDGSDLLTPITTTTDVVNNERVNVLIKDHTATVTGNISSPAARTATVQSLSNTITEVGNLVATKASISDLDAAKARINTLEADNVTINGKLTTAEADIDDLEADNVTINGKLTTAEADIDSLEVNKIDATVANATFATITNLTATNGRVYNLESTYLTATSAALTYATIANLNTTNARIDNLGSTYANIDFANIGEAAFRKIYADTGIIDDLTISEGVVTGDLVGVRISGNVITADTIMANKIVLQGDNGLYYKLNTDGLSASDIEELKNSIESDTQTLENSIHGSKIIAESVTADKVNVTDLVAFGATIGGFNITNNSLYSGVKNSIDNNTKGIYMDDDGQIAFGDGDNYIKFYDDNGTSKLKVKASEILFNTGENVETVVNNLTSYVKIDTVGGQPLLELGNGGQFKVQITNDEMRFKDGENTPAKISNKELIIDKANVKNEIRFGGFALQIRKNGNAGFVWKGDDE